MYLSISELFFFILPEHCACSFIADIVFAGACQVFVSRDFSRNPTRPLRKRKERKKKIRRDVKDKITSCMVRSYACMCEILWTSIWTAGKLRWVSYR